MKFILFLILICIPLASNSHDDKDTKHLINLANQGNSEAMYNLWLGVAERVDSQTPPTIDEMDEAREWLIKAGDLNNYRAAHVLALCYLKGCWYFEINEDKAKHYKQIFEEFRPANTSDQ